MVGKEKVWLITGCSTGFGRALAQKAIAAGYKVVVTARDKTKIHDLVESNPENTIALTLDVTNKSQVSDAVKKAVEKFGRIDVLVNNAAISVLLRKVLNRKPERGSRSIFRACWLSPRRCCLI